MQEQLAENAAYCTAHNLSAKNYYISFYGSGMTEEIYTRHLTDQVKAQAYKAHLIATLEPDPDQLEQALADQPGEEYQSVDLKGHHPGRPARPGDRPGGPAPAPGPGAEAGAAGGPV